VGHPVCSKVSSLLTFFESHVNNDQLIITIISLRNGLGTLLFMSRNLSSRDGFLPTADFWLFGSIFGCVAIPFLKLMMVTSADRCLHATGKSEQTTWLRYCFNLQTKMTKKCGKFKSVQKSTPWQKLANASPFIHSTSSKHQQQQSNTICQQTFRQTFVDILHLHYREWCSISILPRDISQ
jgi:hypothetical protein